MMGVVSLNVFRVWDGGREQVFRDQKFGKIYIMLGINEIGYGTSRVAEAYKAMVQKFQQLQPQANIYVQSLLPVCESKTSSADRRNHVTNAYIRELNAALQTVCADCQVYFVNLYEAFADASGGCRPASAGMRCTSMCRGIRIGSPICARIPYNAHRNCGSINCDKRAADSFACQGNWVQYGKVQAIAGIRLIIRGIT